MKLPATVTDPESGQTGPLEDIERRNRQRVFAMEAKLRQRAFLETVMEQCWEQDVDPVAELVRMAGDREGIDPELRFKVLQFLVKHTVPVTKAVDPGERENKNAQQKRPPALVVNRQVVSIDEQRAAREEGGIVSEDDTQTHGDGW